MITDINSLNLEAKYTYADYLTWHFEQTVELIKGRIWKMSPAPRTQHQRILWNLNGLFYEFFRKTKCQAFTAPFDVRLYNTKESVKTNLDIYTVVQPDLCVICDTSKIDEMGCLGAPDLVIEILSPGKSKKEMRIKFELYSELGVREYWIVDPEHQAIQLFVLSENNVYNFVSNYIPDDCLTSVVFPELKIDLKAVFPQ